MHECTHTCTYIVKKVYDCKTLLLNQFLEKVLGAVRFLKMHFQAAEFPFSA